MTAVLGIGIGVVALVAMALGIRVGGLKSKLTKSEVGRKLAEDGLHLLTNEVQEGNLRHEKELSDLREEIETLYDEMETCGDENARGRVATAGVRRLLGSKKEDDSDTDADPDNGPKLPH